MNEDIELTNDWGDKQTRTPFPNYQQARTKQCHRRSDCVLPDGHKAEFCYNEDEIQP